MANKDLREWISSIEAGGGNKISKGAEPKEEIGGFVDIYQRKMEPGVNVGDIPGYRSVIVSLQTS